MVIRFTVYGKPVPQGSMKSFRHKHTGKIIVTSANPNLKAWRQAVSTAAAMQRAPISDFPIEVSLKFFIKRPWRATKEGRAYPTVKPDLDKLIRAILDSLTGILYHDDAQVVRFGHVSKEYGDPGRVEIELKEIL